MIKSQQLPEDLLQRLRVLDVLDQITQINLSKESMEDSLNGILDLVLEVFNADRAWFLYPCNPDAQSWKIPLERTRPEWPGLLALGVDMPMDSDVSKHLSVLLSNNSAVQFSADSDSPIPKKVEEMFSIKSQLEVVVRPRIGQPWIFGLHHCEKNVIHDSNALQLFTVIAQRISDTLSNLISTTKLRESEEELRAITDSSAAVIYVKGIDGKYLLVNKMFETLFHHTNEEIKSLTDYDIFSEEVANNFRENDLEVIRLNELVESEELVPHDDGTHIYISKKFPLYDKEGHVYAMCGISTDITERKRTEMQKEQYLRFFMLSRDMMCIVGMDGFFKKINPAFTKVLGYSEQELLTKPFIEFIVPEDRMTTLEDAKHQVTYNFENRYMCKDGSIRWLSWTGFMNESENMLYGTARDITERKRTEKDLYELNEQLEERVLQRTQELNSARKQAESANLAKSHFLANMSHEIRTPMNSVLGMAQLALNNEHNPKQRDYLNKIYQSGEHLLGVLDDILDFSKIEADKLTLEYFDFTLGETKDSLINLLEWKAAEKGLKLIFDFDSGIPRNLRGDFVRLNQILINYVGNAIKFSKQGEIIIRARSLEKRENNTLLRFEVQDNGIGVTEEQKRKLFHAFVQADTSSSRQYSGSGLGLAINRRLALLMGGEVGAESQLGKGSTFWATVWLDMGSTPKLAAKVKAPVGQRLGLMEAIQGSRILLVEDSLFNQQVAVEFLNDANATVCLATNGEEALDLLSKETFDCVLMDMQMPDMDGLEATRQIRTNPALEKIPVIAMTANVSDEDRKRCLAAGMDDFIGKPFMLDKFYATIAKYLPVREHQEFISTMPVASILKTPPAGDPNVIDFAVLAEWVGNDQIKMNNFAYKFIDSTKEDIAQIEDALERNDMAAVSDLGHRAKSGANFVGAIGFYNLCQALEKGRGSMDAKQARSIVNKLRPLLERIREEININLV